MRSVLTPKERESLEAFIRSVEARTSAEFVVAVVPCSADYGRWVVAPALLATVIAALGLHLLFPAVGTRWWLLAVLPLFGAFWWLGHRPALLLRLAPNSEEVAAVRGEAMRLFADRSLFETQGRSGVLILISELEHRVEIVADRGVFGRLEPAAWDRHVATLTEAIRKGQTLSGLQAVIEAIAATAGPPVTGQPGGALPNVL
jgi:putative membrane protein